MRVRRFLFLGGALALLGVAASRLRPARLLSARVTALAAGDPPLASVALTYGPGIAPTSLIVDLRGAAGAGSATVTGQQLFVELPIAGSLSGDCQITTTATYQLLGLVRRDVREF